jgi:ankyrin repeat protein
MCIVPHCSCLTRISLPSQVHRQGVTPLHIAAAIGHPDMMLTMIRSTQQRVFEFESGMRISRHKLPPPPDVNVKDTRGRSALHVAAAAGSEACVGLLIQASATLDSEDSDKVTPLAIASACGHKNVVVELIKAGTQLSCCKFLFVYFLLRC